MEWMNRPHSKWQWNDFLDLKLYWFFFLGRMWFVVHSVLPHRLGEGHPVRQELLHLREWAQVMFGSWGSLSLSNADELRGPWSWSSLHNFLCDGNNVSAARLHQDHENWFPEHRKTNSAICWFPAGNTTVLQQRCFLIFGMTWEVLPILSFEGTDTISHAFIFSQPKILLGIRFMLKFSRSNSSGFPTVPGIMLQTEGDRTFADKASSWGKQLSRNNNLY